MDGADWVPTVSLQQGQGDRASFTSYTFAVVELGRKTLIGVGV
jgi:hypothetical protein